LNAKVDIFKTGFINIVIALSYFIEFQNVALLPWWFCSAQHCSEPWNERGK